MSFTRTTKAVHKNAQGMEIIGDFQNYLQARRGSSERTVRAYIADVSMALNEMPDFEIPGIEQYLAGLSGRGVARSTVARKLAALRAYGDFLAQAGHRAENPAQRVSAPHRSYRVASDDYSRQRDRCLRDVARATGLLIIEIVAMNAEDLDWRRNIARVETGQGPKIVGLGASSRTLRGYLGGRARGPIFLSSSGERLSVRLAHDILNQPMQG